MLLRNKWSVIRQHGDAINMRLIEYVWWLVHRAADRLYWSRHHCLCSTSSCGWRCVHTFAVPSVRVRRQHLSLTQW